MAPTPTVFEQLRRPPSRTPGWSGKLLMFSLTALFAAVLSLAGLTYGYKPRLERQINELQRESQKFSQEIPVATREEIVGFYSQIANIKTLLGGHVTASKILDFLEAKTLPALYYDKFILNVATRELQIAGKARSVQDVGNQIRIFQNEPLVHKATVRGVTTAAAGVWSFDSTLTLDPALLGQAQRAAATSTAP